MKRALFYNLKFTKMYINLQKNVFLSLKFMPHIFIRIYYGWGGREVHETF
jgi:hypothetical protein